MAAADSKQPVWLITGASSGFGLALCLRALAAGHAVVGAMRDPTRSDAAAAASKIEAAGGRIITLDLTEPRESIIAKVAGVGRIDYLINNGGYSVLGVCEELSEEDVHKQLRTNLYGPLWAIQGALPGMRARYSSDNTRSTVVNLSSVAARDPLATCGAYSASKAGLEALSESLAIEVGPLGVDVLVVEPGAFRTNFLASEGVLTSPSGRRAAAAKDSGSKPHEDGGLVPQAYQGGPVEEVARKFGSSHGLQPGDPEKGAARIFEAVAGPGTKGHDGPASGLKGQVQRLVLGDDALQRMRRNNARFVHDMDLGEAVAKSTAF